MTGNFIVSLEPLLLKIVSVLRGGNISVFPPVLSLSNIACSLSFCHLRISVKWSTSTDIIKYMIWQIVLLSVRLRFLCLFWMNMRCQWERNRGRWLCSYIWYKQLTHHSVLFSGHFWSDAAKSDCSFQCCQIPSYRGITLIFYRWFQFLSTLT